MDTDDLLRLWRRRGGWWREFIDGEIQLLNEAGEVVLRATPDAVASWLRVQLASPLPMLGEGHPPKKNEAVSIPRAQASQVFSGPQTPAPESFSGTPAPRITVPFRGLGR